MTETEVRARVKELKNYYVDLTLYGAVNLGIILIWAISGGGYFWPIWVIVGWGIGMALKAISLDMIPALSDLFPFFDKTWEEQQVKRMLNEKPSSSMPTVVKAPLKTVESNVKAAVRPVSKTASKAATTVKSAVKPAKQPASKLASTGKKAKAPTPKKAKPTQTTKK